MKNLTFIIAITLHCSLFTVHAFPQPCLPEGITFSTQSQIDDFQINYPGCTEIEGDVTINGDDISNLTGLNVITDIGGDFLIGDSSPWVNANPLLNSLTGLDSLTSIGGNLYISGNYALTSLTGLDNLTSIGEDLFLNLNHALINLTGLENLTSVQGSLWIGGGGCGAASGWGHLSLISLTGLDNVTFIGGDLWIGHNFILTNLSGLNNLISIGGHLFISTNPTLTSLTGLENLTSVGEGLTLYCNSTLTSLAGLDNLSSISGNLNIGGFEDYGNSVLTDISSLGNLNSASINNLDISFNTSLSTCEVQSICNYLASPNGTITIQNNAPGCNSVAEVEAECENNCLPDGITFSTQAQIDSFQVNYPGCTEIGGDVEINGDDITNLNGLNVITAIGGDFFIGIGAWGGAANPLLFSLEGLDNLASIEGDVFIAGNESLLSLSGLDNLSYIGGDLTIGGYYSPNPSLTTLTGLESLTSIIGSIYIQGNPALSSLTGLENLTLVEGNLRIGVLNTASPGTCGNPLLTNLSGLDNLTSIGGYLGIYYNNGMINLTGLDNLTVIGNGLLISSNETLESLDGLENVISIGESLCIGIIDWYGNQYGNPSLASLTGLENIEAVSIENLTIVGNDLLSNCNAQSICDYLISPTGTVAISNNAPGCNNPSEIADACGYTIPCLPYGNYYFITQDDIDNFEDNYPGCTELEGNVKIGGWYGGSSNITNLDGLHVLTSIGGDLEISATISLTSFTGLDNLISIGGNLSIWDNLGITNLTGLEGLTSVQGNIKVGAFDDNPSLSNFAGLDNLMFIGGEFVVGYNDALISFAGLQNLTSIGADLRIYQNNALISLAGLDSLNTIGGTLRINYNDALISLTGLEGLTSCGGLTIGESNYSGNHSLISIMGLTNLSSVGGDIKFMDNNSLISLNGLNNIDPESINSLYIRGNSSLSDCDAQSICNYLASPYGTVTIAFNDPGCNSPEEVQADCENDCLPAGITFSTQSEIDNFLYNYPYCSEIGGDIVIHGDDITNLSGLSEITSIGGDLTIHLNPGLNSLTGLNNMTSIWGNLWIKKNDALASLDGLDNLISIGGNLWIEENDALSSLYGLQNLSFIGGDLWIKDNNSLASLSILANLATINGGIYFFFNDSLSSLSGIENLNPASIDDVSITNNNSLSTCDVKSICDYLASPNANVEIHNNSTGCNSPEELEEACNIHCLIDGITFSTQEQIDDFQTNYPVCNKIDGDVKINGADITNLNGLSVLNAFGGDLFIGTTSYPYNGNPLLSNLSGLENITYIGGDLKLKSNVALNNLSKLVGLTSIGGDLTVSNNNALKSLTGLDNIYAGSIENITIRINDSLSVCNVQSICDYLVSANGTITIQNNAPGCNSIGEVSDACFSAISETESYFENNFTITPIPLGSNSLITYTLGHSSSITLKVLDINGRSIATLVNEFQQQGEYMVGFDGNELKPGIYFCVLKTSVGVQTKKMIKL